MVATGLDIIGKFGGLHKFNAWNKPILTDSGGFKYLVWVNYVKIKEEGVYFQNPIDGSKLFLSPEKSMEIQTVLNSDIAMILMSVLLIRQIMLLHANQWSSLFALG